MNEQALRDLTLVGKITLSDFVWHDMSPVEVEIRWNGKDTSVQVDWKHRQYRVAKLSPNKLVAYEHWIRIPG